MDGLIESDHITQARLAHGLCLARADQRMGAISEDSPLTHGTTPADRPAHSIPCLNRNDSRVRHSVGNDGFSLV